MASGMVVTGPWEVYQWDGLAACSIFGRPSIGLPSRIWNSVCMGRDRPRPSRLVGHRSSGGDLGPAAATLDGGVDVLFEQPEVPV